jgi:hypothetical protein
MPFYLAGEARIRAEGRLQPLGNDYRQEDAAKANSIEIRFLPDFVNRQNRKTG